MDVASTHFRKAPKQESKRPLLANPSSNFDNDERGVGEDGFVGRFKLGKFIWIGLAVMVSWFFDFHRHLFWKWPNNLWREAMVLAVLCLGSFASLFLYLNYCMPYVRGITITTSNWRQQAPRTITAATLSGMLAFFFLFISFWPVYRLSSFVIFPVIFVGFFSFLSLF